MSKQLVHILVHMMGVFECVCVYIHVILRNYTTINDWSRKCASGPRTNHMSPPSRCCSAGAAAALMRARVRALCVASHMPVAVLCLHVCLSARARAAYRT